jgi:predicted glutamine amidotransferase/pimeloyl-ACP methyl ester carboxylesterase
MNNDVIGSQQDLLSRGGEKIRKTASAVVLLLSVLLVFSSVPLSVAFPLWGLVSGGAITVNLQSPSDGSTTIDNMPDFKFIATQSSQPKFSCSLWLQNATMSMVYATRDDVENGALTTVTPSTPLSNGDWWWWISCSDGSASGVSDKRRITVSVFRGDKTFTASFDGSTRYYWLDLPDNFDSSTPTPLVFYLHGYGGSRNSYLQQFPVLRKIFQSHTWIVAAIECREVRGYDNWYTESTRQDITDVLNILRQTYSIDPSHIHIFGRSMGGSGSLKYAMYNNEVIASLVDIHGVSNFTQFYADTATYKASLEAAYGGKPSTVPYVYKSESALGNEYRLKNTPVMILHGTADDQVKMSESRNLYQSLNSLGYTVRYVEVPGGGHTPSIAYGREMEIFNWFNDHPLWCASDHCRMWGMVSLAFPHDIVMSQLVSLTDSLKNLGGGPDGPGNVNGWGLVYYGSGAPVVARGQPKAYTDSNFNAAAQVLASSGMQVGMGHVRNAASGAVNIPDPHPFIRVLGGKTWTLAHNGVLNIANLKTLIGPTYLYYLTPAVGSNWDDPNVVDSDLYLIYILKCVEESSWDVKAGIAKAETEIYRTDSSSNANFLLSDGTSMWGYKKSVDSSHPLCYKYDAPQHYSAIASQPPEGSGLGNWISMSNFNLVEISANSPSVLIQDIRSYGLQDDDFTVVVLPDTQFYSESYPAIFNGQTQWVSSNKIGMNVVFVTHEGDLVNTYSQTYEWQNADSSMSKLDEANIPWGVLPGNHDLTGGTTKYNTYFGYSRFSGLSWYGGAYLNVNTNSYELFTGGLDDYLIFHFQYQPSTQVLAWANSTIQNYPGRRVIVTTHDYMNTDGSRTTAGNNIWNKFVKPHADQVFLVLCGHNHGENEKIDVVKDHTVYQLLADYQDRSNGGNGWLRILEFHPSDDDVIVKTYSPYLGQYETDADSSFILTYDMAEPSSGSPDFTISADPSTLTVPTTGGSATSTVTVSALNGFTGTVTLTASKSWVTFNPSSIVGSGVSVMTVNVPAGTTAGTYPITVTGASGSLSHSTTVNVNVQAPTYPLSITVKTDKSSYSRGQTVTITVRVTDGVNAVMGASVSVKVTNPRGSTSTYSATTDKNGNAVIKYKLSYLAQKGTYTVTATASKTGYKSASATTNFKVN